MSQFLITGASRGIGRAIALELAGPGQRLLLHGRARKRLDEAADLVRDRGGEAVTLVYDLLTEEGVSGLVHEVGDTPLDALVHNAGIAIVKPFTEVSRAEWEQSFAVNVMAPFLLTQRLLNYLPSGASIVHILSTAAKRGFSGWSAYCMSKFALEGFSQSLREELRPRNIRVINVYPSATDTDIWNSVEGSWPRENMLAAAEVGKAVAYAIRRPPGVVIETLDISNVAGRL